MILNPDGFEFIDDTTGIDILSILSPFIMPGFPIKVMPLIGAETPSLDMTGPVDMNNMNTWWILHADIPLEAAVFW